MTSKKRRVGLVEQDRTFVPETPDTGRFVLSIIKVQFLGSGSENRTVIWWCESGYHLTKSKFWLVISISSNRDNFLLFFIYILFKLQSTGTFFYLLIFYCYTVPVLYRTEFTSYTETRKRIRQIGGQILQDPWLCLVFTLSLDLNLYVAGRSEYRQRCRARPPSPCCYRINRYLPIPKYIFPGAVFRFRIVGELSDPRRGSGSRR